MCTSSARPKQTHTKKEALTANAHLKKKKHTPLLSKEELLKGAFFSNLATFGRLMNPLWRRSSGPLYANMALPVT